MRKKKIIVILITLIVVVICIVNSCIIKTIPLNEVITNLNEAWISYADFSKIEDGRIKPESGTYYLSDDSEETYAKIEEIWNTEFKYAWKCYRIDKKRSGTNGAISLHIIVPGKIISMYGEENVVVMGSWIYILHEEDGAKKMINKIAQLFQ